MRIVGEVINVFCELPTGFKGFEVSEESGKKIRAVGVCGDIKRNHMVELYGDFRMSADHGKTFYVDSVKIQPPATKEEMIKFMSSGLLKGVGETTAQKIYEKFGDDSLKVLSNPMELAQVKGITIAKARKISDQYRNVVDVEDVFLVLSQYNLSRKMIMKLYERYGHATISVIHTNPYQLIEDIRGIGFLKADEIALKVGIPWDSEFRIVAGIKYILESAATRDSHTYLPESELYENLLTILEKPSRNNEMLTAKIDREKVDKCLNDLVAEGDIFYFPTHPTKPYMLRMFYYMEKRISRNVRNLLKSQRKIKINLDYEIARFEELHNITLHENQKKAVQTAIQSGICIITGGPGVGKTTIITCIISILKNLKAKIALAAPTGRAAKRMEEATGVQARTIHRLLEYRGPESEGGPFGRCEDNPLEEDAFIIDEMSMTDEMIFDALLKAIRLGSRLILVGDKDQLPSVGAGNVLGDLIESGEIETAYLTHIYRQEGGNKIANNAQLINEGKVPNLTNEKGSKFNFLNMENEDEIIKTIKALLFVEIPKATGIAPDDIQVMCPIKRGRTGVDNLNIEIRKTFMESRGIFLPESIRTANGEFYVGDKVMQTTNRYDATILNEKELQLQDSGVYNGDVGYIKEVDRYARTIVVEFTDGKLVVYKDEEVNDIILAYAITVHKSQGSEFPVVIIVLRATPILTRSMLYTAVTRAKKSVLIIGSEYLVRSAVDKTDEKERHTFLKEFLTGEII